MICSSLVIGMILLHSDRTSDKNIRPQKSNPAGTTFVISPIVGRLGSPLLPYEKVYLIVHFSDGITFFPFHCLGHSCKGSLTLPGVIPAPTSELKHPLGLFRLFACLCLFFFYFVNNPTMNLLLLSCLALVVFIQVAQGFSSKCAERSRKVRLMFLSSP